MKVLVVTNIYPFDEMPHWGSFVKSQMDSIAREGVDVTVAFINSKKQRFAYIRMILRILRLKKGEYDLIHAHYGWAGLVARFQLHTPLLVSFCGSDILGQPGPNGPRTIKSCILSAFGQILNFTLPAAIVKSEEMKRKLIRRDHVRVVPNGVNYELFRPMNRQSLREQFSMNPDKHYILFAYNPQDPRKGHALIEKAVNLLNQQGVPTEIFYFRGYPLEDMPKAINACDALVMASMWEGSPNLVKESMACNLPIVSVIVGDVTEILKDCEGCAIAKRNPADIAVKLKPILLAKKRTQGRENIRHLEIQNVAKTVISLYKSMLKSRP